MRQIHIAGVKLFVDYAGATCVGMNRLMQLRRHPPSRVPHVRGDEPPIVALGNEGFQCQSAKAISLSQQKNQVRVRSPCVGHLRGCADTTFVP